MGYSPPPRTGHYLEIMELEWDWLDEVVAALSCENPLWLQIKGRAPDNDLPWELPLGLR